jgi:hypothetical protein
MRHGKVTQQHTPNKTQKKQETFIRLEINGAQTDCATAGGQIIVKPLENSPNTGLTSVDLDPLILLKYSCVVPVNCVVAHHGLR